ncbi:gp10 [Novosphingobium sp. Rr 2-17]|uniref:DNA-methyltransferase n=1 Tax=Novosphingobium sp. Rr 2-17 TaxID=555793 RepID=UPI0002698236|nr:site-specific DNA-methyltransferase [Novosphingobium sp. Rr 2-17]EIZ78263.1 gp10 [Novosphingobium sp. Rr 2-17]
MSNIATANKTARQAPGDMHDDDFLDALDYKFASASVIARRMAEAGTPATLDAIHARMAEFVSYTDEIEAYEGIAWRIVPPLPANDNVLPANDNSSPLASELQTVALPTSVTAPLLVNGCGLELVRRLPDKSIDLALLDLPYGTTNAACDHVIDVDAHMMELRRIITDRGAIVCFAMQPFTTTLINAAPDLFKQSLVWEKPVATGWPQARARHLKCHEDILVFSKGTVISPKRSKRAMTYNPQNAIEVEGKRRVHKSGYMTDVKGKAMGEAYMRLTNCPRSVLRYAKDSKLHPFAKPVALLEYLVRTFSNENEIVLDHTMGSGSTGVAAFRAGRRFIGAENGVFRDGSAIFPVASDRITAEINCSMLPEV